MIMGPNLKELTKWLTKCHRTSEVDTSVVCVSKQKKVVAVAFSQSLSQFADDHVDMALPPKAEDYAKKKYLSCMVN